VVTLGGPPSLAREFNGARDLDGYAGVRELRSPLLLLTSRDDGHARVPDERRLLRLAATRHKRLIVYPGFAHATALLYEAPYREGVSATLLRFLASGAP
jgi:alpha-beta hydrolase superfamily lysophospholipase